MDIRIDRNNAKELRIASLGGADDEYINYQNDTSNRNLGLEFMLNDDARVQDTKEQMLAEEEMEDIEENAPFYTGGNSGYDQGQGDFGDADGQEGYQEPQMSYEDIQKEKAIYLSKLKRLAANPTVVARKFTFMNSLEEIKGEVMRIEKDLEIARGINFCRNGVVFFSNMVEMASGGVMEGWSNVVMVDINNNSYDAVLEELYEKYSKHVSMGPELKLISMIAGSAFMFHLQKNVVAAGVNRGNSGGGGNWLSSMFGNMMGGGSANPQQNTSRSPFGGGSASTGFPPEMRGPSINADDLLARLDDDAISDVSSVISEKPIEIEVKKKRGRKAKNAKN